MPFCRNARFRRRSGTSDPGVTGGGSAGRGIAGAAAAARPGNRCNPRWRPGRLPSSSAPGGSGNHACRRHRPKAAIALSRAPWNMSPMIGVRIAGVAILQCHVLNRISGQRQVWPTSHAASLMRRLLFDKSVFCHTMGHGKGPRRSCAGAGRRQTGRISAMTPPLSNASNGGACCQCQLDPTAENSGQFGKHRGRFGPRAECWPAAEAAGRRGEAPRPAEGTR